MAHDAFWDHGTWYRKEYVRVGSRESFEALVLSARTSPAAEVPEHPRNAPLTAADVARAFQIAAAMERDKGASKVGSAQLNRSVNADAQRRPAALPLRSLVAGYVRR